MTIALCVICQFTHT